MRLSPIPSLGSTSHCTWVRRCLAEIEAGCLLLEGMKRLLGVPCVPGTEACFLPARAAVVEGIPCNRCCFDSSVLLEGIKLLLASPWLPGSLQGPVLEGPPLLPWPGGFSSRGCSLGRNSLDNWKGLEHLPSHASTLERGSRDHGSMPAPGKQLLLWKLSDNWQACLLPGTLLVRIVLVPEIPSSASIRVQPKLASVACSVLMFLRVTVGKGHAHALKKASLAELTA